ncbi:hypothetical protein B0T19DRAFT_442796 [Cercophora scortea]|uniref:Uncharacterized protein n=1 Tax=Cercophora scortea TaxID=314031 RepID=A0AAE0M8K1_9PEZI|nr:hypothetical protein B0T19DRAFT_442796 [Cercophora scortea]
MNHNTNTSTSTSPYAGGLTSGPDVLTAKGYIVLVIGAILSVFLTLVAVERIHDVCTNPPRDLEDGADETELQVVRPRDGASAPGSRSPPPPYTAHEGA